MEIKTPQFTTYLQAAKTLLEENPKFYSKAEAKGVLSFAKYLDSGRDLNNDLKILAIMQARKIDGEVIREAADTFGLEPMQEVVKRVYARHKHAKE